MSNSKPERTFVLTVNWADRQQDLHAIRNAVFVEEQSVPANEEWDGKDEHCVHFLAVNEAGVPLGCARLQANGKVERMAVLEPARGLGIGAKLLEAAIETARDSGLTDLYLHAQRQAEPFYRHLGFLAEGETFVEANIDHVRMTMALPLPFVGNQDHGEKESAEPKRPTDASADSTADTPADSSSGTVGQNTSARACKGEGETRQLLLDSLVEPRRTLLLYTQELDSKLLDNADIASALSTFVRQNPSNQIHILIHTSRLAVSRGHRLVELARRMESKIQLRLVPNELATEQRSYACWDTVGYWLLPNYNEYVGLANNNDPVLATRLTESFERLWHRSNVDPELRILGF